MPCPAACDVEDARFHHDDLATLDEIALTAELLAITGALARPRPHQHALAEEWLQERHERVRAALRTQAVRAETGP